MKKQPDRKVQGVLVHQKLAILSDVYLWEGRLIFFRDEVILLFHSDLVMCVLNAYDAGASPLKAHKGSATVTQREIESWDSLAQCKKAESDFTYKYINMPDGRG